MRKNIDKMTPSFDNILNAIKIKCFHIERMLPEMEPQIKLQ